MKTTQPFAAGRKPTALDEVRIVATVEHVRVEDDVARHARGGFGDHFGRGLVPASEDREGYGAQAAAE